ncbi:hypothetical protein ACFZDK_16990 [Streptomyces sp. NPDC007901]|uniref:hypothetical protein n=1 Tax=Streptomyces sp. NPDC007901 TaxID=3364785 RepID=UPI0036E5CF43
MRMSLHAYALAPCPGNLLDGFDELARPAYGEAVRRLNVTRTHPPPPPGDWGGPVDVGTQLWLPLGTAAVALSAWGRPAVARGWLAVTGRLPWRLMAFLEDAHRRGVLRQSGAYFDFRHLRLQSYLANETADVSREVFPAGPPGPREAAGGPVRERGGRPG